MRTYRIEKRVSANGKIELEGVPFEAGEIVEIIVLKRQLETEIDTSLEGSIIEYTAPTEPVAENDWEVNE